MNRKEWLEVGRQSLYFVLAAAGLVLLVFIGDLLSDRPLSGEKIAIILGLWLLMFSMFMGLSPFAMDSRQKGMEYLLSLPFSRRRLLLIKFLPRLAAAILFYLAFAAFYSLAGNAAFGGGFTVFSLTYFVLFLISFSLAVVHENFIVQSLWVGIALSGYLGLCLFIVMLGFSWKFNMPASWAVSSAWQGLSYDAPTLISASAVFLLMALPFILSFFLAFKRFDLKPARAFNRRQLLIFLPLLLLAFSASLGLTWVLQRNSHSIGAEIFLLENGRLLKADFPGKLTLYDGQGQRRVDTGKKLWWEWIHFETPGKVFLVAYDATDHSMSVIRLGLKHLDWQVVHSVPGRSGATSSLFFRQSGQDLVFLQRGQESGPRSAPAVKSDRLDLVQLDMNSERVRTISFQSPSFSSCINPFVFAHDEDGGRSFWLACGKDGRSRRIFRLWQDGIVDDLGVSKKIPAYLGRLLFSHGHSSLLLRRLTSGGDEKVAEIPGVFDIGDDFFVGSLNTAAAREVFGTRNKRLIRLDLETLAVEDLGAEHGQVMRGGPVDFYYVEHKNWRDGKGQPDKWRKVFRLHGRERTLIRQFDFNGKWPGHIWMQRNGIILRDSEERKDRFFAFPDLRELKLKK